jgi:hypothetical protein
MRRARIVIASLAFGTGACSSSSSGPNLDSNEALTALSSGDQGRLCDWEAQQYGGYGKTVSCGTGLVAPLRGPTDQASCVSALRPSSTSAFCQVTVGQFETCARWRVQNGCGTADPPFDCVALRNPNCSVADAGGD